MVILSVRAALHNHAALNPESFPKLFQRLDRSQWRIEWDCGGEGIVDEWAVDVSMTITSASRERPARSLNVRLRPRRHGIPYWWRLGVVGLHRSAWVLHRDTHHH